MGLFYTNFIVKSANQAAVAEALTGRAAFISPSKDGYLVVYDKASEEQDFEIISELGMRLSQELNSPVLASLIHDGDIFFYELYENGELTDGYNSSPNYFDQEAEPAAPEGGDAKVLCAAFKTNNESEVSAILRKSTYDDDGLEAFERHQQLLQALRLPLAALGMGYNYLAEGELPEGISKDQLLEVQ